MKILITVQTYFPKKDGVQMVTQYLAEGLVKRGHEVTVITTSRNGLKENENYNGVNIQRINLFTKYGIYLGDKMEYINFIQKKSKEIDIMINVCTQNAFTDLLLKHLKNIECKKILYLHGMHDFKWHIYNFNGMKNIINKLWKNIRWKFYYSINAKNFKIYDKVIELHKLSLGYEYFIKKYNIKPYIIENAADSSFFKLENIKNKENYAICVANYIEDKNQKLVLEAFYKSKSSKKMKMIFIGGKQNKYYKKLIIFNKHLEKKYGKRNVKFLTGIQREKTIELIKNSSLYLFGSKHEIYPVSIIEAISSGIPFISTDVGCVKELQGGLIIKNSTEMANKIDLLNEDEKLYNNLKKIAIDYAKNHFMINEKVNKLDNLINSLFK